MARKATRSLADQMKAAIRNSGQSLYEIAKRSGVGLPVLYRFMVGQRDIRLATAGKLAEYLELELRPRQDK